MAGKAPPVSPSSTHRDHRQIHSTRPSQPHLRDSAQRLPTRFNKCFYAEGHVIRTLSEEEVTTYRRSLNTTCSGFDVPRPIKRFEHAGFDAALLQAVRKHGYETPTPIQCQVLWPAWHSRTLPRRVRLGLSLTWGAPVVTSRYGLGPA